MRNTCAALLLVLLTGFEPAASSAPNAASATSSEASATGPRLRPRKFTITEADRGYWAFQPVRDPAPPVGASTATIDAFHEAALREIGLIPNPPATPRELVRRVSFDLLGLPPRPEWVEELARDPSDAAWSRLVDRLLASPHYGERWGRHWLDLVRYAESNGYERDGPKPHAWRYRDYVIRAFQSDKPYDRFIREQLAGDELAAEQVASAGGGEAVDAGAWREAIIATGFYRLHVWDDEPDSTLAAEFDDLDDILVTTGTAFLGLTLGCARCHDHKYDPLSQADYYSMLAFLRGMEPYGQHHKGGGGRGTGRIQRPLVLPAEVARWESAKQERIREAQRRLDAAPASDAEARKGLEAKLKEARDAAPPFDQALAISENGFKPTHVLARGDVSQPREEVQPAFPDVFGVPRPATPVSAPGAATLGRRRQLADWIASPAHPLTARVLVNRLWQHHFGTGLVPTPDDFGLTGMPPTHPELLDFLAARFVASGWSIKAMHRLILNSRAYRMSSRADDARALARDEANTRLWHQNLRRVEAEAIRDAMLFVAGNLNPKAGGPSVFPTLPKEVHGTQDSSGKGWTDSPPEEQDRRSVYLVVKRALKIPLLESFDFANSTSGTGTRPVTTTAPQALMLLNDAFVQRQARVLAERLAREAGPDPEARVRRAFALAFQREPTAAELRRSLDFLAAPLPRPWESFCRSLLNLNESLYID